MNRFLRVLAAAGLVLLAAPSAHACGMCVTALVWIAFPPLLVWGWVGLVWFLVLSVLAAVWKRKIRNVPRPLGAVGTAIVALMAFAAVLGPLATLVLGATALFGWLVLLGEERRSASEYPVRFRVLTNAVSGVAVALIVFTGGRELVSPTPRSPVDVILRWEPTSPAILAFAQLLKEEPQSVSAYRRIVREADGYAIGEAAKRLAVVGDREIDVSPIIDALGRAQSHGHAYEKVAGDIGDALREATGLSLSKTAPAAEWRRAWAAKENQEEKSNWPPSPRLKDGVVPVPGSLPPTSLRREKNGNLPPFVRKDSTCDCT